MFETVSHVHIFFACGQQQTLLNLVVAIIILYTQQQQLEKSVYFFFFVPLDDDDDQNDDDHHFATENGRQRIYKEILLQYMRVGIIFQMWLDDEEGIP